MDGCFFLSVKKKNKKNKKIKENEQKFLTKLKILQSAKSSRVVLVFTYSCQTDS